MASLTVFMGVTGMSHGGVPYIGIVSGKLRIRISSLHADRSTSRLTWWNALDRPALRDFAHGSVASQRPRIFLAAGAFRTGRKWIRSGDHRCHAAGSPAPVPDLLE